MYMAPSAFGKTLCQTLSGKKRTSMPTTTTQLCRVLRTENVYLHNLSAGSRTQPVPQPRCSHQFPPDMAENWLGMRKPHGRTYRITSSGGWLVTIHYVDL